MSQTAADCQGATMQYDDAYYAANNQDRDRPALWFYQRLWRRYCGQGPILELGCGVGHFARRLSGFAKVFGLEINPYAIARIRDNAPDVILVQSMEDIATSSIGSVVSLHVLEHIPDDELDGLVREFHRVLVPGGRIMVVMPDLTGRASALKGDVWMGRSDATHINLKGSDEWRRYLTDRWGFSLVSYGADGYYDFPYQRSVPFGFIGDFVRASKTGAQFALGRLLLPAGDGEAVIFILEKQ